MAVQELTDGVFQQKVAERYRRPSNACLAGFLAPPASAKLVLHQVTTQPTRVVQQSAAHRIWLLQPGTLFPAVGLQVCYRGFTSSSRA